MIRTMLSACTKKKPASIAISLCVSAAGKGDNARNQHDRSFNTVTPSLDRYRKAGCCISQYAALGDDSVVERQNDGGAERCEQSGEGLDDGLLNRL
jgi:hypothetical protein